MEERRSRRTARAERSHVAAALYGLAWQGAAPVPTARARDEALSLISHELCTPVATILGSAQILERLEATLPAEERVASLATIVEEALRLGHLLDDLFVLAHVETADDLLVEPVALRHVIEHHVEVHARRHPTRRIELLGEPFEAAVTADPSYLGQVLNNLLDNAERHSPPATPILVVTALEGREVTVRVIDRGPGIEPEEREGIFVPFSPLTAGRRRGIGASLAASKRLVEAHGGRIWTQPYGDGGTEFGFTLPAATEGDEHGN